jgi:two-component system LytT family response regulator
MLNVLIADDEPLVRSGLRSLLEAEPDVAILGEAHHGGEAVSMIRALKPDLVFLDVQMPEIDGFAVLAALEDSELPAIVFVTAFDEYAIRAFDEHAVDYLLKPFDADRFGRALARGRSRLAVPAGPEQQAGVRAALETMTREQRFAERLLVKNNGRTMVLQVNEIDWIESADNYVRLHTRAGRFMVREPIRSIEARLSPRQFARAHRSVIVNLSRVRELEPLAGGEYVIILTNDTRLTLSRSYRDQFRTRLLNES